MTTLLIYLWATALVLAAAELGVCPPEHKRSIRVLAFMWPILVILMVLVCAGTAAEVCDDE